MRTFGGYDKDVWSSKVITAPVECISSHLECKERSSPHRDGNDTFFHGRLPRLQGFLTPALHVYFQATAIPHAAT
eukprot:1935476-Ditylum_brightwellii.AAC.1